jgi:Leucine-rich repeat (LRR) protein
VYEGIINANTELKIKLNFLVLLDSSLVGSYNYEKHGGTLILSGKQLTDSTVIAYESLNNEHTGTFEGLWFNNKEQLEGFWYSPNRDKSYPFQLTAVHGESFWNYIKKFRSLPEFTNLDSAVRNPDFVLALDVKGQRISELPSEVKYLRNMISCNLIGNPLKQLNPELLTLKQLEELSLSSTQLENLPKEIGNLTNLRVMTLNFNKLTEIPDSFGQLTSLLYLDLGDNNLTSLPKSFKYLTQLQELKLDDNNFSEKEKVKIKKMLPNCKIFF